MSPEPTLPQTAQQFRDFFASCPSNQWISHVRAHEGKHCAFGWLDKSFSTTVSVYADKDSVGERLANSVIRLFGDMQVSDTAWSRVQPLADINNGDNPDYKQDTPQARVLAACDDLIKAGR